jgi:hypothetical protein
VSDANRWIVLILVCVGLAAFAWLWLYPNIVVPWQENHLVQYLLGTVTAVTVGLVNLLGVPALRHGTAIQLAKGIVGLDAVCSGIQSFLASVVASLFLGLFFCWRYCAASCWLSRVAY